MTDRAAMVKIAGEAIASHCVLVMGARFPIPIEAAEVLAADVITKLEDEGFKCLM